MLIRVAKQSDANDILKIYTPYVKKTNVTFEYDVPTLVEMEKRIAMTLKKYPYLVAEINEDIVGYAYASCFHERKAYQWACELSVYVNEKYHGQGIARHLYESLFEILKDMHIEMFYANITHPNIKSESFHDKLGFKTVAIFQKCGYKFNEWQDVVWKEKRIGQFGKPCDIEWFSNFSYKKYI